MSKWLLLVLLPMAVSAADMPCTTDAYREFDFWLGDWTIEQTFQLPGQEAIHLPATTHVETAADGCAVVEHWQGEVQYPWEGMTEPESISALSVRSYNMDRRAWEIRWLDSRHPVFGKPYVGNFDGDIGDFHVTRETPQGDRRFRIRFEKHSDDHVTWTLAMPSGDEHVVIWTMEMQRKK